MISLSFIQTVSQQTEYLLVRPGNSENSLYECIGTSLFYLFPRHTDLKFKFFQVLRETLRETEEYKKNIQSVLNFIEENESEDQLARLCTEPILENLVFSIYAVVKRLSIDPNSNVFEVLASLLETSIEIQEKNTKSKFGRFNREIKMFKQNNQCFGLIPIQDHLKSLETIISNFNGISESARVAVQKLMSQSVPLSTLPSRFKQCSHGQRVYRTICGQDHCAYCLAERIKNKPIEKSFCLCNFHISRKNYFELSSLQI